MIISIIIPTRERVDCLKESIQTVLQIPDRNIEILISDNASTDGTGQVISEISDPRIKYVNTGKYVSQRESFEFALHNSSGDYVTFLGDDDGILPRQFKLLRHTLEKERPDALSWTIPVFIWPVEGRKEKKKTGNVRFDRNKLFGGTHWIDTKAYKRHLLACRLEKITHLPTMYHGCVSRDYFNKIATPDGTYFNSTAVDAYFGYRSLLEGGKFLHVDHALSMRGDGPSGGMRLCYTLPNPDDPQAKLYYERATELKLDRITDVIETTLSAPLLLFSTLETIRTRFPKEDQLPDYLAWYNHTLSENSPWNDTVREILRNYAIKSDTFSEFKEAAFRQADNNVSRVNRKISSHLGGIFSETKGMLRNYATRSPIFLKPKRFHLSCEVNQKNTILTAVNIYDSVLSDDYECVPDKTLSQENAWKRVLKRSRAYSI
uniref:Glycosyl transferase family 2 n=1 Tax=Candidatus Kentrum sp. FW TaxID=2126338 RepID=A0A450TCL9_9GAMM|nr:MAG: Glycosyl transferase family 2 [Candidatus Kentron sp. FW]